MLLQPMLLHHSFSESAAEAAAATATASQGSVPEARAVARGSEEASFSGLGSLSEGGKHVMPFHLATWSAQPKTKGPSRDTSSGKPPTPPVCTH